MEPYLVISSDTHAGLPTEQYRAYVDADQRAAFDEMLEAQNAGDAVRLRSMLSERPDAVHIGTDAEEWWTSKQVLDATAAAGGGDDIRAVADDIDIHVQGDIA